MTFDSILFFSGITSVTLSLAGALLAKFRYSSGPPTSSVTAGRGVQASGWAELNRSVLVHAGRSLKRRQVMEDSMLRALELGNVELNEKTLALLLEQLKQDEALVQKVRDSVLHSEREGTEHEDVEPGALVAGAGR